MELILLFIIIIVIVAIKIEKKTYKPGGRKISQSEIEARRATQHLENMWLNDMGHTHNKKLDMPWLKDNK